MIFCDHRRARLLPNSRQSTHGGTARAHGPQCSSAKLHPFRAVHSPEHLLPRRHRFPSTTRIWDTGSETRGDSNLPLTFTCVPFSGRRPHLGHRAI